MCDLEPELIIKNLNSEKIRKFRIILNIFLWTFSKPFQNYSEFQNFFSVWSPNSKPCLELMIFRSSGCLKTVNESKFSNWKIIFGVTTPVRVGFRHNVIISFTEVTIRTKNLTVLKVCTTCRDISHVIGNLRFYVERYWAIFRNDVVALVDVTKTLRIVTKRQKKSKR